MANDTDSEMINLNASAGIDIGNYRKLVQSYLNLHLYEAALFWADKVVALTSSNAKDVYWLAQCMYHLKQYHRAAHLLRNNNLDKTYVPCNNLVVRCLLEAHEYNEALKVINLLDIDAIGCTIPSIESGLFDDTPKYQMQSAVFYLKGKVLEAMDNRGLASEYYKKALQSDVYCYEAFECLTQHNMLAAEEEYDLINSLHTNINQQCTLEEAEVLLLLYRSKLKKYHMPAGESVHVLDVAIAAVDMIIPNTPKPNNAIINTNIKLMDHVISTSPSIQKIYESLDMIVSKAEQLYYNCDYQKCAALTESILKQDPYHSACLPIHISCLVELKQSNKLFTLAHKLVELYPNLAISWYAVGCYYYIIDKCDAARRYLLKATSLDRLFGPAWLAYGHSFAIENEHDQAMAAYFKASQLMKGCHLPLMYIGLECGLTNNNRLADKFFKQASKIAPDDPFVLHERGVVAFQNQDYHLAETYYRTALKIIKSRKCTLMPEQWAPLHNNLGHALRKQKNYKQALIHHHKALVLMPQNHNIYSDIAFVHALMNNLQEAADWFHRALGLRRDDTFSTTMLGLVIEQLCEDQLPYPDAPEGIPNFVTDAIQTDEVQCSPSDNTEYEME